MKYAPWFLAIFPQNFEKQSQLLRVMFQPSHALFYIIITNYQMQPSSFWVTGTSVLFETHLVVQVHLAFPMSIKTTCDYKYQRESLVVHYCVILVVLSRPLVHGTSIFLSCVLRLINNSCGDFHLWKLRIRLGGSTQLFGGKLTL